MLPPDDPAALTRALVEISGTDAAERARMGERGRKYFEAHFTKDVILPRCIAALRHSAEGRGDT